jgi:MFS family permease
LLERLLLPAGVSSSILRLLAAKALRAFADGYMAVLLPAYLLALGFGTLQVGILSTATLLGSAFATLAVGAWGHRLQPRRLLPGAALLMLATGLLFASFSTFWPLLLIAFVGTSACSCRSNMRGSPSPARAPREPPCLPVTRCWAPCSRHSAHWLRAPRNGWPPPGESDN